MFTKNALISVYYKTGIITFARELHNLGWKIISSGGTARALQYADIGVTDVAKITGTPPVLGHRVVTLAKEIHGGLLASEEQKAELEALGWPWIDLLCADFYPLEDELLNHAPPEVLIEKTDIGGPTLVRSSVKGGRIVVMTPEDRALVIQQLKEGKEPNRDLLACRAEETVEKYVHASVQARLRIGMQRSQQKK